MSGEEFPVSVERVLALYERGIRQFGGSASAPKPNCVEGALGQSTQSAFYACEGEDPDIFTTAAFLLLYMAKAHCFTDGNKRVAWLTFCEFLAYSGSEVNVDQDEAASFVLALIERKDVQTRDLVPEITLWMAQNLRAIVLGSSVGPQIAPTTVSSSPPIW